MILLDAIKDLLGHVCSAAEKTVINEAIDFFTKQTPDKSVTTVAATSDARSAEYRTIAENALIGNSDPVGQNTVTKDCRSESSSGNKEIGVAAAEVEAGDNVDQSVDDVTEVDRSWKLFITVHSHTKNVPHRYGLHCGLLDCFVNRFQAHF